MIHNLYSLLQHCGSVTVIFNAASRIVGGCNIQQTDNKTERGRQVWLREMKRSAGRRLLVWIPGDGFASVSESCFIRRSGLFTGRIMIAYVHRRQSEPFGTRWSEMEIFLHQVGDVKIH